MKILLTGHQGYIGSVLAKMLVHEGHDVMGLDTGFFNHGHGIIGKYHPIPSIYWDVRDVVLDDLEGFDAVIHLAALSNDQMGDIAEHLTYDINWQASLTLAILAKKCGVKRFLFASSTSVYGAGDGDNLLDEEAELAPLTAYARTKIQAEEDISCLTDDTFTPVFLRNATAYGFSPFLRTDLVVNTMTAKAFTTGKINIYGSGRAWRPLVHVEDIAQAFALALIAPKEVVSNQAINVGSTLENYQMCQVAEIVRSVVPGSEIEYVNKDVHDPRNYRVDFTKITSLLPFAPKWDVYNGVMQLYDEFKKNGLNKEDAESRKFIRLKQLRHLLDTKMVDESLRWR